MSNPTLQAVVFDWAGTMIDHGSQAPMGVFVKAFETFGVEITVDEARGPMGMAKRDHIKTLLNQPRIAAAWTAARGSAPGEADIDAVYEVFVPMNVAVVSDYATLIEGLPDLVARLRERGLKIARPPATSARSWRPCCRWRRRRAMRPTTWCARATSPKAAPRR